MSSNRDGRLATPTAVALGGTMHVSLVYVVQGSTYTRFMMEPRPTSG